MAQLSFFDPPPASTLAEIAALAQAVVVDTARVGELIRGLAALDDAGPRHLSYFDPRGDADALAATRAGACLISEQFEARVPPHVAVLRSADPFAAFVRVAGEMYRDATRPRSGFGQAGIAASAVIHPTARLEDGVLVDPLAVIGPGAEIGTETVIGSGAVIGAGVRIGRGCSIGAHASIQASLIGNNVVVHPGCHIGQDGYGFGSTAAALVKLPHPGRVLIQNHVEIGAGTTIDRGALRDTVIGEGTKIDNQVQIGHDVTIGRHCRIAAQAGLSGGIRLGDAVTLDAGCRIAHQLGGDSVTAPVAGPAAPRQDGERQV
jgi:UDP-3-O-[3-hydroxymyristoyl] glucosamine N-acyltransferase